MGEHMNRKSAAAAAASLILIVLSGPGAVTAEAPARAPAAAPAQVRPHPSLPAAIRNAKLETPVHGVDMAGLGKVAHALGGIGGQVRVIVRLSSQPAASLSTLGLAAVQTQIRMIHHQQAGFTARALELDPRLKVLGSTNRASNIVALRIDASAIGELATDPSVVSIRPVVDYRLALSATVPYIGAAAAQGTGRTGAGIRVGVIDSGIDYTHKEFGGPGTLAAYESAYGTSPADPRNTTTDGLFPTSKVAGGYDFVGETWANGATDVETPDPDPIDHQGHGTHVADIIGGLKGVAPGVSLYALKACSAISTECSGVALIEAMDYAVDPNGDGNLSDHLDIVNMSIGADYGSAFDDNLALAVDKASEVGVLTVAAAGNGGDHPYIAGTPGAATSAISVAETQVPSAAAFPLIVDSPPAIAGTYPNTATVDWAPLGSGFSGDVVFVGRGCPDGSVDGQPAADPYLADPTGKVALIDRGACNVSGKVDRAAKAGAVAVLVGLVAPGDPVMFAAGGGDTFVPTMVITQALSSSIKDSLAEPVHVSASPALRIKLVGSMAGSSSRGPSMGFNLIKPEIGAPGASVSAVAGSGDGAEAFGGTSGATPMVTGAAALLRGAFPTRPLGEIKAVLMNSAETRIFNNITTGPGYLAPITRIGGGEVRVDRALKSPAAAWDTTTHAGDLSFGFVDVSGAVLRIVRTVVVRNYTGHTLSYAIKPTFRYANDRANGAVQVVVPASIVVPANGSKRFKVTLVVHGPKLRAWTLDSGGNALDSSKLGLLEYDGYINFDDQKTKADDKTPLHLAWQVLPRLSGNVTATSTQLVTGGPATGSDLFRQPTASTTLVNTGVGVAAVDAYSLVATSPSLPPSVRGGNAPVIDLKALGVQTFPVDAGYCGAAASFVYAFAISTYQRLTIGSYPAEFDVFIDTNGDGTPDYVVFNAPASGQGTSDDVRTQVWVGNLATQQADSVFYADHGTNDSNMILPICADEIGLNATNLHQPFDIAVGAFDDRYTGNLTDSIDGLTVVPLGERYVGLIGTAGVATGDIPARSSATLTVLDGGALGTNPTESGLLLILDASRADHRGGAPANDESLQILVAGAPAP